MRYFLYIVFFIFPVVGFAQPASSVDIGGGIGISSYYGDINQEIPFYNPRLGIEGFMRLNFNHRYAVRANFFSTSIVAHDRDFKSPYQKERDANVEAGVVEFGLVGEVNFFPYVNPSEWGVASSSLYGLLGVAFSTRLAYSYKQELSRLEGAATNKLLKYNNEKQVVIPVVIVGVGYKKVIGDRISLEIEWAFRKCLEDGLDGVVDPTKSGVTSKLFNNDWYNILEAKLSFNIWQQGGKCRTFEKDSDF